MAAIDEARRFLYLHPYATTDLDNPVTLLESLVNQFAGCLAEKEEEKELEEQADDEERADAICEERVSKLLAFVKGLRDDMKICEAEYQTALALAK